MTTTYTFDNLKEDVRKEAEALRVHATKEELGRLDFDYFDEQLADRCIYGLATGSCVSPRAHELINKCCPVYIDNNKYRPFNDEFESSLSVKAQIESLADVRSANEKRTTILWLSAIEAYILLPEARNANLIAYLRGETDTLDL